MGIAKVGKSGGSGGALNYVLKEEHAEVIGGNVSGTKEEIKEQFEAFEDSRSSLTKNTTHITWSFAPGEEVSDEKAVQLAEALLEKLKFEKTPYLIVRHSDKEKRETEPYQHIHIVAGRIRADRSVVPDFQIARRTIEAVKELEREHGLQQTPFVDRSEESQPKREELKMIERTGELSARLRLQEQIKEVAAEFPQTRQFVEELERRGIAVEFNLQKTGRIAGVSFETNGVAFKGSSLGKNYSWNGLQKQQGLNYERERDFAACQKASQRAGARRLERAAENRVEPGDDGKREVERRIGQTRDGFSQTRAGDDDHQITTETQEVGRSEHGFGKGAQRLEDESGELSRRAGDEPEGKRRAGERVRGVQRDEATAEHRFEQRGETEQKLEGEGGGVDKRVGNLANGDLGRVEDGRSGVDRVAANKHGVDRDFARAGNQKLVLDHGAAETADSIRESTGRVSTDAEFGDKAAAERIGDKAQQKARAVTQSINLAYGGSLLSEVQEEMTMQLAEHGQLNDYYEQTRLTRWHETIEMSQNFVETTANSLGTVAPQPPETELERNERLSGWMQATVQVAVYEQAGRELDKEVNQYLGERFAAGYEKTASDKEIGQLERMAERNGVAPPFVETQSETRAAILMNATSEEIAQPVLAREREVVQEREQRAQALEQAKQERQQTRERGGYGMSR